MFPLPLADQVTTPRMQKLGELNIPIKIQIEFLNT